jgi:hypothetical protein
MTTQVVIKTKQNKTKYKKSWNRKGVQEKTRARGAWEW